MIQMFFRRKKVASEKLRQQHIIPRPEFIRIERPVQNLNVGKQRLTVTITKAIHRAFPLQHPIQIIRLVNILPQAACCLQVLQLLQCLAVNLQPSRETGPHFLPSLNAHLSVSQPQQFRCNLHTATGGCSRDIAAAQQEITRDPLLDKAVDAETTHSRHDHHQQNDT